MIEPKSPIYEHIDESLRTSKNPSILNSDYFKKQTSTDKIKQSLPPKSISMTNSKSLLVKPGASSAKKLIMSPSIPAE